MKRRAGPRTLSPELWASEESELGLRVVKAATTKKGWGGGVREFRQRLCSEGHGEACEGGSGSRVGQVLEGCV